MPIINPYKSSAKYPGSTKIAGMLDKPYLVKWANSLGKENIDVDEYVKETAKVGTLIHNLIEAFVMNEEVEQEIFKDFDDNEIKNAYNGLNKFKVWFNLHKIEPIFCEKKFISETYKYVGIIDFYCKFDDKYTIIDFKTSKSISEEHLLQLSSYYQLLKENELEVDQVMILNIPRDENIEFCSRTLLKEEQKMYFDIFKKLLDIYYIKFDLDWS